MTHTLKSAATIVARQQSTHSAKPAGCNGWWSTRHGAILHSGAACPVHDDEVAS